jgi:hypothetical protein
VANGVSATERVGRDDVVPPIHMGHGMPCPYTCRTNGDRCPQPGHRALTCFTKSLKASTVVYLYSKPRSRFSFSLETTQE